ncbi:MULTISPECIES: citrate synthase family protein [unclassified Pigmentiphaga]|uniref:citrate synthase family protein n=1 Tax=unclassified Pigmentiphaga TaxID=2626614 RepID=UPI000B413C67|nr:MULTISPECIES: citrate synthase family protein [unclassified Pigmentiphaga]OVZ63212.1 hypothetical protein CDO46_13170 [Pigmentiphaga sp. NML030171]
MAWMTAQEAIELTGVRAQTLYAYVSRGKVRCKRDGKDPRRSLYHRDDVVRMAGRPRGQRNAQAIAGETLEWGAPVLPSAVSTVQDGQLWYRGLDAVELARGSQLEDVARLLWDADAAPGMAGTRARAAPARDEAGAVHLGLVAMATRAAADLPTHGRAAAALKDEARAVLATLAGAMFGARVLRAGGTISEQVAAAWERPRAEPAIRQALCLMADHELNASTFAARVAISTGASLAAGVLSGLATLTGPLHGRAPMALKAWMDAAAGGDMETEVRERLRLGQGFPAFGHPLYPEGDPRAAALLDSLAVPAAYRHLARQVERLVGESPNIDFALAVLADVHDLPPHAPLALFAMGRCVGWLAHALEQAGSGHLIRPRARYVGPPPEAGHAGPRRKNKTPRRGEGSSVMHVRGASPEALVSRR